MKPKLFFKRNSSTILTVLGCAGVVATAVLSVKAAPKAKRPDLICEPTKKLRYKSIMAVKDFFKKYDK